MTSRIASVTGRQLWDSRGRPTVEAEVLLESGAVGRAIAPAGASRGAHEAIDLRDGGTAFGGYGVNGAVAGIGAEIAGAIAGMDARDQAAVDKALCDLDGTPNKARLGANAVVAVSMAVLHAAAADAREPLWRYLAGRRPVRIPLPEIQIFGGGAHAGRRTDVQDFMVMCPKAGSFRRALEITDDVYRAAGRLMEAKGPLSGVADEGGWWPNFDSNEDALDTLTRAIEASGHRAGEEVFISLDIAANELGDASGYSLALDDGRLTSEQMAARIVEWAKRYPILSIEDPAGQDDWTAMAAVTAAIGDRVQIIGDDVLVTNAERVERAGEAAVCNAALIKVNQVGTVTEAKAALDAAVARGWGAIVSARSGESEDVTIAHLATGWDAGQLKVGSFTRSERMAKWNEMLRIEEAMGADAVFAGFGAFAAPIGTVAA
ncbi:MULTISPECIES: phosphopyruvate hydratase [Sphingopyxis]|uniref:phosphopyruvate hydratase n=1 Tax=Sphingopyxis TaxID=165697 RepID=UPI00086EDC44|nr:MULTISPECIES: phosphopyruvate hydratase [Sphingopyxis]APW71649.1 phosphopyruvate hydratase [Sphingopyxis granuli]AVA15604.1 phosphopyruvate hydratase [Sphingopyxis sp. MG]ODU33712.1 MAG: phosphopyruvate hydratase [Sphingopyxis sp. SCN 67-31]